MKTRALRIVAVLVIAIQFAACSGGQSGSSASLVPNAQPSPASSGIQPMAVINVGPNEALTVTGQVVGLLSNGFQIEGGRSIGYFDIYTTSATVFVGAKPFVGEIVVAAGTGTTATSLNATTAGQLFTVSGTVGALITGGFQMQAGSLGSMYVYTTPTTLYSGAKAYVGESLTIQGTGTPGSSMTAVAVTQNSASSSSSPSPAPTAVPTAAPTTAPTPAPTASPAATASPSSMSATFTPPPTTAFMPSTWGKIGAMQVFDDTANGYITQSQASTDGYRYSAVWGSRNNIGTSWLNSNPSLQTGYYNALETDESSTAWGAIGHSITWWQANHPDWVLYACTSAGAPTTTPAYVPGLASNVPLDVHNPAVVDYQVRLMANYAHSLGYRALAIDEATFWQADEGVSGGYGCGIYSNGSWVRRYTGPSDPNWAADVVAWVKQAHSILTTDPTISTYHLKLLVNHPADQLTANETALLANVDAVLNETGYTDYGRPVTGSASSFKMTTDWTKYAQQHGVAVLTNQNWGSMSVGAAQLDYSVATYLMGNEQAESLFASPGAGYGLEQWHTEYTANIGAPCGEYYSANDSTNPSIYYRRFANAIVVVNGGSGGNSETAYLPSGHTYIDLFGRAVSNALTVRSNDGYVLLTTGGCK
jgi:hypothetical protein